MDEALLDALANTLPKRETKKLLRDCGQCGRERLRGRTVKGGHTCRHTG